MAEMEDRALGEAIRRRRTAVGLQQREMAERIGVASVVYGRMELGNRPVRATELRDIARALGDSTDAILREVSTITPEELIDTAVAQRDRAYAALRDYGAAVVQAAGAITEAGGALAGESTDVVDADDLARYLRHSQPFFDGITAPADTAEAVRGELAALAESVGIRPTDGADGA